MINQAQLAQLIRSSPCPLPQVLYTAKPEDNYLDGAINATLQVGPRSLSHSLLTVSRLLGAGLPTRQQAQLIKLSG
jgi:hypothetical protein